MKTLLTLLLLSSTCYANDTAPLACLIDINSKHCTEALEKTCESWGLMGKKQDLQNEIDQAPSSIVYACEKKGYIWK